MLSRRAEFGCQRASLIAVIKRVCQSLGSWDLNAQRTILVANCRNDSLRPVVLAGNAVGNREELWKLEYLQPLGKPADIVLSRPVGNIGNEDEIGRTQGSPHELGQSRRTVDDNLVVNALHCTNSLAHALLHLHEGVADFVIEGLLRDHHQRFFVIQVMRAGYDIERRFASVGELYIPYFAGDELSVVDSLIVRDLRKQAARRVIGIAGSAPALMSHKHYRCACLCIEIDHEHSLPARDRQTIGQHHGDCRFSDATAAIGYSDEGGHKGLPKLLVRPGALFPIGVSACQTTRTSQLHAALSTMDRIKRTAAPSSSREKPTALSRYRE